jgi:hypothetical protein
MSEKKQKPKVIKRDQKRDHQRKIRAEITMLEILIEDYPEQARRFVRKIEAKAA